jgi:hypothetical protein
MATEDPEEQRSPTIKERNRMWTRKLTAHNIARAIGFAFMFSGFLFLPATLKARIPPPTPTPTPTTSPTPDTGDILLSKYINTYVSVIDPNIAEDVFGKRISDRFVVIQVTISNKNSDFQFLIHDVSLDLTKVFGKNIIYNLAAEASDRCPCMASCMAEAKIAETKTDKATDKTARIQTDEAKAKRLERLRQCRVECSTSGDACTPKVVFELSSLELSLIRGVAEKGQAQDRRNKILRYLEGAGTVAASFIGFAGVGPKYSDFMALYNGDFLAAYRHVYPDFTINQMNRLSDSAYRSNTLIPKEQAKVIVAFIPQAIFLTPDQRKKFRKDPTSLYPDYNSDDPDFTDKVDFRRSVALVDGKFVVELKNLPLTLTGIQIDPDQAQEFLKAQPVVKGYILGQFLEGANITLMNPAAGVQVAPDDKATPDEGKLFFVITANGPVESGTHLSFRVFNKQNAQTFDYTVSYTIPVPHLNDQSVEGTVDGPDVAIDLPGTNLFGDNVTNLVIAPGGSGVKPENIHVETKADGSTSLKATLKMAATKAGPYNLKARNGKTLESNSIPLTIKPKQ